MSLIPIRNSGRNGRTISSQGGRHRDLPDRSLLPNELVRFADEDSDLPAGGSPHARLAPNAWAVPGETWKILIVDDDREVHSITRIALQRFVFQGKNLEMLSAHSAAEAHRLLDQEPDIAVLFLDVIMETDAAGLDVVRYVREELNNQAIRIVLRTGQAGTAPEESVILRYDINDYRTKTELTRERLITTLLVSLRTFQQIRTIERQRGELEQVYAELLLQNMALESAREAAEAASHAKSEFLSTVGHELRTPLSVILMKAQSLISLRAGPLTEKQLHGLGLIERSGKQLLRLIVELLDIGGKNAFQNEVGAPLPSIAAIIDHALAQSAGELAGLRVSVRIADDIVPTSGAGGQMVDQGGLHFADIDGRRLTKIIAQLAENAGKFTEPGGAMGIDVECEEETLVVTVWDTGIGISPADQLKIFEPFTQLESTLIRRYEGAGLGLTIAKRLIEQLGGTISLRSSVGHGSRFTVNIPIGAAESDTPTP